jgi:hypothetical protein
MAAEHLVRIHWSDAQQQSGLPDVDRTIDPAWQMPGGDGWSLIIRFERTPKVQGNPSTGFAQFLVADQAPTGWLQAGTVLHLFERNTGKSARLEVLD